LFFMLLSNNPNIGLVLDFMKKKINSVVAKN